MDKYEYKIRLQEIKDLIAKGEYAEAAAIADTIDWTRVKSVMMLCTISDLYKINRRLEDARDLLLLAYDRYPGGRSIVYSLCELFIKMGDVVQAVEYYKEFVQIAPKDSGRYILQYKLYEAQDVSIEERIEVLKELKSKEYTEKWAYELAYLYHRIGLGTKCVEECDELILWFGEGRYVMKAMELKMLHEPLTPSQEEKYAEMKNKIARGISEAEETAAEQPAEVDESPTKEILASDPDDIQVKVMNVGQYDTINMQKELAANMKELWEQKTDKDPQAETEEDEQATKRLDVLPEHTEEFVMDETKVFRPEEVEESLKAMQTEAKEEVFFGETEEIHPVQEETAGSNETTAEITEAEEPVAANEPVITEEPVAVNEPIITEEPVTAEQSGVSVEEVKPEIPAKAEEPAPNAKENVAGEPMKPRIAATIEPHNPIPQGMQKMLGMEYDGQISMVVPETEKIEKQITGQISLEDVLAEWERVKKENEQKRMQEVQQHILQQTGAMFTEFEAATRDGLLEKLEKGKTIPAEEAEEIVEPEETDEFGEFEETDPNGETDEFEEIEELEEAEEPEKSEEFEDMEEPDDFDEFEEPEVTEEFEEIEEPEVTEEIEEVEETEESGESEEPEETEEFEEDEEPEETEEFEEAEESEETGETEESKETEETGEPEEDHKTEKKKKEADGEHTEKKGVRKLTKEEKALFGTYLQNKHTRDQIVNAIDKISLAAYTGNIILTGEEGMDTLTLAKKLMKEVQQTDSNFSGKIAKISAGSLNQKGVTAIMDRVNNGALIIQKAGALSQESVENLEKALNQEHKGVIVILEDTKGAVHKLLRKHPKLKDFFNIQIHVEALDNDSLVSYGKKYAESQEYGMDELGVLALHTCIAERQTSDHAVTMDEVKEIMDAAIRHANKKTLGHFFEIIVATRYDEEDRIILREKDFR